MTTSKSMQITDPDGRIAIPVVEAAVGVIQRSDGALLITERPAGKEWAGYWEFPGGKIEADETAKQALARELREELGITPTAIYPWLTRLFHYQAEYDADGSLKSAAKIVKLHFFVVTQWHGEPAGLEQQAICWQYLNQKMVSPMLPANIPIVSALRLPSVYAITNLSELGEQLFFEQIKTALENGLTMIQIRERQLSTEDLLTFTKQVIEVASPYNAQIFLNSGQTDFDTEVASKLGMVGVHVTAQTLMQMQTKPEGVLCGASCHNRQELAQAAVLGMDYVLLSPVKTTLSHPHVPPIGWDGFRDLIADYALPVYALGGMRADDLHIARLHGAHGVAMQREVWI